MLSNTALILIKALFVLNDGSYLKNAFPTQDRICFSTLPLSLTLVCLWKNNEH